jgi:mono/diheme cytochrome c family protein
MFKKILAVLGALVVLGVAGFAMYVGSRQHLTFDAPYPEVAASTDSAVVARGRYVVRTLANCWMCHGDPARQADTTGAEIPLSGGYEWRIPPGEFYARNITPDSMGIGSFSDAAIARALRYGVGHDGRALLPFMEVQGLSDEDLIAIVSYLRTQPAVHNPVPPHHFNLLGKMVKATALAKPVGPRETPLKMSPRGATIENGRYLVESVANCWACHTQRSQATGALTGPRFAGATDFKEPSDPEHLWAPPNITSDPETGRLGKWSEDEFVARFRLGRIYPKSPMPWQSLKHMNEDDLRAIYRYLKSVPPVHRDVGPPMLDAKG